MIEILTSGVALGVHVPGLVLADRLREQGVPVAVRVLEQLLPERALATTADLKWAFHRSFRFALTGLRVAADPSGRVLERAVDDLAATWRAAGVERFVLFSGYWLPLVQRYRSTCRRPPPVDVCHVDSVTSPSFRGVERASDPPGVRHVWLADAERRRLPQSIPVSRRPPLPWSRRARRLLVHGGGWGIGTYRERARELRTHGFALDLVAYERADVSTDDPGVRYFMVDPDWHPWLDDGYPPFDRVDRDAAPHRARDRRHHGSFHLTRTALATVSKPGGGTLLDSLWSATPAVFLEPFGDHERHNAELWRDLGFGIGYERWAETGFDPTVLEECHHALLRATPDVPDYSRTLTEEMPS